MTERYPVFKDTCANAAVYNCPLCGSENIGVLMRVRCCDCGLEQTQRFVLGETQEEVRAAIYDWNSITEQDLIENGIEREEKKT